MKTHLFSILILAALLGAAFPGRSGAAPAPLPEATAAHLPRWRGFNLLEKYTLAGNRPFAESNFQFISEQGFNFVRLPMDYRIWIKAGDWKQIDESAFPEIDQAVAYGQKYGIHVCLNFHRAPGYTVASPKEARDLWTDPAAQEVCAAHWAYFARRYKGIPNRQLSFDLLNEPGDIQPEAYRAVVQKLVAAIHREDPERLIIADGLRWGTQPCLELADLGVAQATRGYTPIQLTHYRADWIPGGERLTAPCWPMPRVSSVLKQGYPPKEPPKEIVIEGPFTSPTSGWVAIGKVQAPCRVMVEADGKPLAERSWDAALNTTEYITFEIPAGTRTLKLRATTSWALASTIALRPQSSGSAFLFEPWEDWGIQNTPVRFTASDTARPFQAERNFDGAWLREQTIAPWKHLEAQGVGVMVGEFGVYNRTPHAVALAFLEDNLRNWREAGWGWALWDLSGPFGVLDSQRADVVYEDYKGHKLDRAMLELLRKY